MLFLFDELKIKYEVEPEETTEFKSGYVVRCDKEIGDTISHSEEETIKVYYAVKPVETTTEAEETPEENEAPEENTETE